MTLCPGWGKLRLGIRRSEKGERAQEMRTTMGICQLVEAGVTGIGSTPRSSLIAEDIRDLQLRTGHCRERLGRRRLGAGRLAILLRGFLLWLFGLIALLRLQVRRYS